MARLLATLVTGYSRIMLFLTMIGVICICYGSIFPQYFLLTLVMPRLNQVRPVAAFVLVSGAFCAVGFYLWLRRTAARDLAVAASLVERERRRE